MQGAGLWIYRSGTATLINSNVYENEALSSVCSLFEPSVTFHPLPLWMEELDLALAARRAVASLSTEWLTLKAAISTTTLLILCACILNFLNFHPSPLWMEELDRALAARRAVASLSMEWLTLKAAISMTTPLIGCACILNLP